MEPTGETAPARKPSAMPTIAAIVEYLEQFAPPGLAAAWDNVGLLLGDAGTSVTRIMTCLTMTPESAAEAVDAGAQLVVTHHPVLFRPVKRLTADTSEGRMLLALIRAGVSVYSPHTSFDNTEGGINETLSKRLGLLELASLRRREGRRRCKIVVFVPEADLARVADALFAAGAGNIGQYSQCSFRLAGTGTFFGSEAAHPTVGEKGRREEVGEWRLEAICPEPLVDQAIAAMRRAHSYEEPAYDVYPLRLDPAPSGEGRIGRLQNLVNVGELAQAAKLALGAKLVQVVGELTRPVERVAVACGAGGEFLPDAVRARADVLLTGEARFHDCLAAQAQGLALVLPGHFATERFGVEVLAARLRAQWPEIEVWASEREHDPMQSI
jgi:dinuclear metal center YbgI/SA1388 family protein